MYLIRLMVLCLTQTPRATAKVVQPETEHIFFPLVGSCLAHNLLFQLIALVVQPIAMHVPNAPCRMHSPRATTLLLQPSTVHGPPFLTPGGLAYFDLLEVVLVRRLSS